MARRIRPSPSPCPPGTHFRGGLPVIVSVWRAIPEIVVEGETGFLVPVRDASATAKSLAALLSDPALRKRMGAAGRRRYEDHYRVEVFQRGMEDALISVGGTAEKPD